MSRSPMTVVVKLAADRVNSDKDEYLNYSFPPETKDRAIEIVKNSLYPYPIKDVKIVDGFAVATLEGPPSVFKKANVNDSGSLELDTVDSLAYNYGDGGPDGWMEGDIFIDKTHELWLGLMSVGFYKNGRLELLFEDFPG